MLTLIFMYTHVHTRTQLIEIAQKMNSEILESIKETTTVSRLFSILYLRVVLVAYT